MKGERNRFQGTGISEIGIEKSRSLEFVRMGSRAWLARKESRMVGTIRPKIEVSLTMVGVGRRGMRLG